MDNPEVVNTSANKPIGGTVYIHHKLDPDEEKILRVEYPEIDIVFAGKINQPHSFAAASRVLELQILMTKLRISGNETVRNAKGEVAVDQHEDLRSGMTVNVCRAVVNDIGGNWYTHAKRLRTGVHSCCPILATEDGVRFQDRERNLTADLMKKSIKPQQAAHYTDVLTNRGSKYFCFDRAQDCKHKAPYGIMVHVYDIPLEELVDIMVEKNMGLIVGTMIFTPEVLLFKEGTIYAGQKSTVDVSRHLNESKTQYGLQAQWQRFKGVDADGEEKEMISFTFIHDNNHGYIHDFETYKSFFTRSVVAGKVHNDRIASIEFKENRAGVQFFSITLLRPELAFNNIQQSFLSLPSFVDYTVLYGWDIIPSGQLSFKLKRTVKLVPTSLFDHLLSYCLRYEKTTFNIGTIYHYACSLNTRYIVNGTNVKCPQSVSSDELYTMSALIYLISYIRRFNTGIAVNTIVDDIKETRRIASKNALARFFHNALRDTLWKWVKGTDAPITFRTLPDMFDGDDKVHSIFDWFSKFTQVSYLYPIAYEMVGFVSCTTWVKTYGVDFEPHEVLIAGESTVIDTGAVATDLKSDDKIEIMNVTLEKDVTEDFSLKYERVNVPGDGYCLYHALYGASKKVLHEKGVKNGKELRKWLASVAPTVDGVTEEQIKKLSTDFDGNLSKEYYGDDLDIALFSSVTGVSVKVAIYEKDTIARNIRFDVMPNRLTPRGEIRLSLELSTDCTDGHFQYFLSPDHCIQGGGAPIPSIFVPSMNKRYWKIGEGPVNRTDIKTICKMGSTLLSTRHEVKTKIPCAKPKISSKVNAKNKKTTVAASEPEIVNPSGDVGFSDATNSPCQTQDSNERSSLTNLSETEEELFYNTFEYTTSLFSSESTSSIYAASTTSDESEVSDLIRFSPDITLGSHLSSLDSQTGIVTKAMLRERRKAARHAELRELDEVRTESVETFASVKPDYCTAKRVEHVAEMHQAVVINAVETGGAISGDPDQAVISSTVSDGVSGTQSPREIERDASKHISYGGVQVIDYDESPVCSPNYDDFEVFDGYHLIIDEDQTLFNMITEVYDFYSMEPLLEGYVTAFINKKQKHSHFRGEQFDFYLTRVGSIDLNDIVSAANTIMQGIHDFACQYVVRKCDPSQNVDKLSPYGSLGNYYDSYPRIPNGVAVENWLPDESEQPLEKRFSLEKVGFCSLIGLVLSHDNGNSIDARRVHELRTIAASGGLNTFWPVTHVYEVTYNTLSKVLIRYNDSDSVHPDEKENLLIATRCLLTDEDTSIFTEVFNSLVPDDSIDYTLNDDDATGFGFYATFVDTESSDCATQNSLAPDFGRYEQLQEGDALGTKIVQLVEKCGDLFSAGDDYSLAHCVAEDFKMSKGIALEFRTRFGMVDELLAQRQRSGGLAVIEEGCRFVYYLVTKHKSSGKPTYYTLYSSLLNLREHIISNNVKKLAIPLIGCGLDKLEWTKVKGIVNYLLCSISGLEVVVYINKKENQKQNQEKEEIQLTTSAGSDENASNSAQQPEYSNEINVTPNDTNIDREFAINSVSEQILLWKTELQIAMKEITVVLKDVNLNPTTSRYYKNHDLGVYLYDVYKRKVVYPPGAMIDITAYSHYFLVDNKGDDIIEKNESKYVVNKDKIKTLVIPQSMSVHKRVVFMNKYKIFNQYDFVRFYSNKTSDKYIDTIEDNKTNISLVQGVPGCGKTTYIISHFNYECDLVVTTTREGRDDLANRVVDHLRNVGKIDKADDGTESICGVGVEEYKVHTVKTVDSVLLSKPRTEAVENVYIDEALMQHPGKIFLLASKLGCKRISLLGDRGQIGYVNRVSEIKVKYDKFDKIPVEKFLNVSYRCPLDVATIFSHMYEGNGKKFLSHNTNIDTRKFLPISNVEGIPLVKENVKYLTFTQADKNLVQDYLNSKMRGSKHRVNTVHEYQGSQVDNVVLVRLNNKAATPIYNHDSYVLVALTRHRKSLVYCCLSTITDKVRKYVERVASRTECNNYHSSKEVNGGAACENNNSHSTVHMSFTCVEEPRPVMNLADEYAEFAMCEAVDNVYTGVNVLWEEKRLLSNMNDALAPITKVRGEAGGSYHVLQSFYDDILPQHSTTDMTHDSHMVHFSDIEVNVDNLNIVKDKVLPVYDILNGKKTKANRSILTDVNLFLHGDRYLQPTLRTSMPYNRAQTQVETLLGLIKRNMNAPELQGIVCQERLAQTMFKKYMLSFISFDGFQLVEKFLRSKLCVSTEGIRNWAIKSNVLLSVLRKGLDKLTGFSEALHNKDLSTYKYMIKSQLKPKMDISGISEYQAVQTIAYHGKEVTSIYSPIFTDLHRRKRLCIRESCTIFTELSNSELEEKLWRTCSKPSDLRDRYVLQADISKYDKSQGEAILLFNSMIYKAFGMNDYLADLWYRNHTNTVLRSETGVQANVKYQRKSGDSDTFGGNTDATMGVIASLIDLVTLDESAPQAAMLELEHLMAYDETVDWMRNFVMGMIDFMRCFGCFLNYNYDLSLWAGDDSLIIGTQEVVKDCSERAALLFNLETKFFPYNQYYFCSRIIVPQESGWKVVPDVLKIITKLGRHDVRSYVHLEEYRVSLCDLLGGLDDDTVDHYISAYYSEVYKYDKDLSAVCNSLMTYIKNPFLFSTLFSDPDQLKGSLDLVDSIVIYSSNNVKSRVESRYKNVGKLSDIGKCDVYLCKYKDLIYAKSNLIKLVNQSGLRVICLELEQDEYFSLAKTLKRSDLLHISAERGSYELAKKTVRDLTKE